MLPYFHLENKENGEMTWFAILKWLGIMSICHQRRWWANLFQISEMETMSFQNKLIHQNQIRFIKTESSTHKCLICRQYYNANRHPEDTRNKENKRQPHFFWGQKMKSPFCTQCGRETMSATSFWGLKNSDYPDGSLKVVLHSLPGFWPVPNLPFQPWTPYFHC